MELQYKSEAEIRTQFSSVPRTAQFIVLSGMFIGFDTAYSIPKALPSLASQVAHVKFVVEPMWEHPPKRRGNQKFATGGFWSDGRSHQGFGEILGPCFAALPSTVKSICIGFTERLSQEALQKLATILEQNLAESVSVVNVHSVTCDASIFARVRSNVRIHSGTPLEQKEPPASSSYDNSSYDDVSEDDDAKCRIM